MATQTGLSAGQGQRGILRRWKTPPALDKKFKSRYRCGRGPGGDQGRGWKAVWPTVSETAPAPGGRNCRGRVCSKPQGRKRRESERIVFSVKNSPAPLQRFHHSGNRTAPVFLQRTRSGPVRECDGLGAVAEIRSERLVVPDEDLKIAERWRDCTRGARENRPNSIQQTLRGPRPITSRASMFKNTKWSKTSPPHFQQNRYLYGTGEEEPITVPSMRTG